MRRRTVLSAAAMGLLACAYPAILHRIKPDDLQDDLAQAHHLLDGARQAAGLVRLTRDPLLQTLSEAHSMHMQSVGHATHLDATGRSPDRRANALGYKGHILGEALAETYGPAGETMTAWLDQPATRAVLMAPRARTMGLAMTRGADGRLWWAAVVSTT